MHVGVGGGVGEVWRDKRGGGNRDGGKEHGYIAKCDLLAVRVGSWGVDMVVRGCGWARRLMA